MTSSAKAAQAKRARNKAEAERRQKAEEGSKSEAESERFNPNQQTELDVVLSTPAGSLCGQ